LIAFDAALYRKRTDKARLLGDPVTTKGRRGAARMRWQNLLIRAGFRILRFTAADIFMHPDVVAAQVRGSL
jgi:hypothetical protein